MKGKTIVRWGKFRWQIEGFFKTAKHQFSLNRFGQKTLLGVYRWLILSFLSYILVGHQVCIEEWFRCKVERRLKRAGSKRSPLKQLTGSHLKSYV